MILKNVDKKEDNTVVFQIETEKAEHPEPGAEFYFRGEAANFATKTNEKIGTHFSCALNRSDKPYRWKKERELYQEGLRYNVASFAEDRTMVERLARMQHYRLPTRFCDISTNILLATFFACGGERVTATDRKDDDGYIYLAASPKTGDSISYDCSYNTLEFSFGVEDAS